VRGLKGAPGKKSCVLYKNKGIITGGGGGSCEGRMIGEKESEGSISGRPFWAISKKIENTSLKAGVKKEKKHTGKSGPGKEGRENMDEKDTHGGANNFWGERGDIRGLPSRW